MGEFKRGGFQKREGPREGGFQKRRFGGSGGMSRGGFGSGGMHKAICAECGKECEVPFKPQEGRPVYCRDCFAKRR